jgi:hypothetical protein
MRRAGGWILGATIIASMAAGVWMAFRPILNRETVSIYYQRGDRGPTDDAVISGLNFAIQEADGRAGGYRLNLETSNARNPSIRFTVCASNPDLLETSIEHSEGAETWFSFSAKDERRIRSVAAWAASAGIKSVIVLDWWQYKKEFEAAGLKVLESTVSIHDLGPLSDQIMRLKPDLVFYGGEPAPYRSTFELFDGLKKKGYEGALLTTDAEPTVSFLAVPTDVVEGTLLASPIPPPSREFAAAYEPASGRHAGPHAWPGYLLGKTIIGWIDAASSSRSDDLVTACRHHPPPVYPGALYQYKQGKFVFVQDLK